MVSDRPLGAKGQTNGCVHDNKHSHSQAPLVVIETSFWISVRLQRKNYQSLTYTHVYTRLWRLLCSNDHDFGSVIRICDLVRELINACFSLKTILLYSSYGPSTLVLKLLAIAAGLPGTLSLKNAITLVWTVQSQDFVIFWKPTKLYQMAFFSPWFSPK